MAIPIFVSVLIAWSSRRADGQRWIMLRAAAEAVKEEIYRYRTHTMPYDTRPKRVLQARLGAIDARLVRTEASTAPLTPYRGPLPPKILTPCRGLLPPGINGSDRYDDGLSTLNDDRYLQIRVGDQIAYYHQQILHLYHLRTALELLAISAGGAGAILAALGFDVWIGLTSGMSAAALAYTGYLRIDNSIIAYNRAASRLGMLQRDRTATKLEQLVTDTEKALFHEHAGWLHQMSEALQELKDSQNAAGEKALQEELKDSQDVAEQ